MKKLVYTVFAIVSFVAISSCSPALSTIFKLDDTSLFKKVKSIALIVAMDTDGVIKKKDVLQRTITTYETSISTTPSAAVILGAKLEQLKAELNEIENYLKGDLDVFSESFFEKLADNITEVNGIENVVYGEAAQKAFIESGMIVEMPYEAESYSHSTNLDPSAGASANGPSQSGNRLTVKTLNAGGFTDCAQANELSSLAEKLGVDAVYFFNPVQVISLQRNGSGGSLTQLLSQAAMGYGYQAGYIGKICSATDGKLVGETSYILDSGPFGLHDTLAMPCILLNVFQDDDTGFINMQEEMATKILQEIIASLNE